MPKRKCEWIDLLAHSFISVLIAYMSGQVGSLACYQYHVKLIPPVSHEVPARKWPDPRASLIPVWYPALRWTHHSEVGLISGTNV